MVSRHASELDRTTPLPGESSILGVLDDLELTGSFRSGTRSDGTTLFFVSGISATPGDAGAAPEGRRLARRGPSTGSCVAASSCPSATWANTSALYYVMYRGKHTLMREPAVTNVCAACDANETACKGNGAGEALAW